jgi:hypothetical protein
MFKGMCFYMAEIVDFFDGRIEILGREIRMLFHGHIPWTAARLRIIRDAFAGESVLLSSMGLQYCPELRIPLNRSTVTSGKEPEQTRAEVTVASWSAAGLAISP